MNELIDKQKDINAACGFKSDNLKGLALGLQSELGELSSLIALQAGIKKPKPKDLSKFGRWTYRTAAGQPEITPYYTHPKHCAVNDRNQPTNNLIGCTFAEAWNHEITQNAIKKEIADECADVLVYLLQVAIFSGNESFNFTVLKNLSSTAPKVDLASAALFLVAPGAHIADVALSVPNNDSTACLRLKEAIGYSLTYLFDLAYFLKIDLLTAYQNKAKVLLERHAAKRGVQ